ncbi:MAG: hypothetical protein VX960_04665 [Candidatus Neomarinimicrobiota bacterium]|nr:hypothetical protein [Candidatus Neomarinimicrobiota bacterium]|tara:strand:+ start:256 stop:456 length:201 start_codon:yes stop_codon:yes gene_type:complete
MASRALETAKNFGENTLSGGIVFRTNANTMTSNTTIEANTNAMCVGPITIKDINVNLTVKGNLTII